MRGSNLVVWWLVAPSLDSTVGIHHAQDNSVHLGNVVGV